MLRNVPNHLDERDQIAAAKYAVLASITMPFQVVYFILLNTGFLLLLINLHSLQAEVDLSIPLIALLCLALVVIVPLQAIRIRRARRYASTHADRLE